MNSLKTFYRKTGLNRWYLAWLIQVPVSVIKKYEKGTCQLSDGYYYIQACCQTIEESQVDFGGRRNLNSMILYMIDRISLHQKNYRRKK